MVQHEKFRRILDEQSSQQLFRLLDNPGRHFKISLIFGALRNAAHLNGQGEGRPYLNVGHTGLNSPQFRTWVSSANVRPIYMVHDLIPITHPQFCRQGEDSRHRDRMSTVLRTAAGVIGNSKATLEELANFARTTKLKMPPSHAAWLGSEILPKARGANSPSLATFVTLGTIEARKNHIMLLRIWSRLIERLGREAPQLVIIGGRGWEAEPTFELLDRLSDHVVELNHCSDVELAAYLSSARALLFPSLAEGYGLPLIEALGAGVPVLASDLPVFREIAGDIPMYLDPGDENGWEAAILDYMNPDSISRTGQLERMRSFHRPDWKSHFEGVESWLDGLG